jgi:type II secretory pathway pseudopilin PulG
MPTLRRNLFSATILSLLLAVGLLVPAGAFTPQAEADEVSELQAQVEQSAADYNAAVERTNELDASIEETSNQIAELEAKLPAQREEAGKIIKNEYIYQTNTSSFLEAILDSDSFEEFLTTLEYYSRIDSYNKGIIDSTAHAKEDLENLQASLNEQKADAVSEQQKASIALKSAQDAREAAMEKATQEAAAQVSEQQQQQSSGDSSGSQQAASEPVNSSVSSGSVDWSSDKSAFVSQWAPRINNYLSGTPLAGYGEEFASAAWDYGVDPRWSPAISYVESSCGAHCFRSHNAWGWGNYSFDSWEEAIPAHVAYLGRKYGSTLTYSAAQTYCPPNASHWYNTCLSQMNQI